MTWFALGFSCFALAVSVYALTTAVRNFHRVTGKWFPWQ